MSTQSRIFRFIHTSVTNPCMVSGSMRGRLPASGSPLGLPLVTSNRKAKSCLFVGSQKIDVAVVVMIVTPLHFPLLFRCLYFLKLRIVHCLFSEFEREPRLFDDKSPARISPA